MDDYLSKPIDNEALFSRLNDVAVGLIGRAVEPPPVSADGVRNVTVDPARLEMIAEVMVDEPFGEFFDVFLSSTAERIGRIGELVDHDDFEQIGREAHTLLGTAANFGALWLSQLAVELRSACDAGNPGLVRHLAGELTEAMSATSAAVLAWLNERRAPHAA
jgi:HPt (histidine-containing phosphotransfer) domain-containing protein